MGEIQEREDDQSVVLNTQRGERNDIQARGRNWLKIGEEGVELKEESYSKSKRRGHS